MAYTKRTEFSPEIQKIANMAKALSHPARVAILATLAEKESCICGEIVEVMPLAQSTVSQHLKELQKWGLITGEIEGPTSCYCINRDALGDLSQVFTLFLDSIEEKLETCQCREDSN